MLLLFHTLDIEATLAASGLETFSLPSLNPRRKEKAKKAHHADDYKDISAYRRSFLDPRARHLADEPPFRIVVEAQRWGCASKGASVHSLTDPETGLFVGSRSGGQARRGLRALWTAVADEVGEDEDGGKNFAVLGTFHVASDHSDLFRDPRYGEDPAANAALTKDFFDIRELVRTALPKSLLKHENPGSHRPAEVFAETLSGSHRPDRRFVVDTLDEDLNPAQRILLDFFSYDAHPERLERIFEAFEIVKDMRNRQRLPQTELEVQALALLVELATTPTWTGLLESGMFLDGEKPSPSTGTVGGPAPPDEWFLSTEMRERKHWSSRKDGWGIFTTGSAKSHPQWLLEAVAGEHGSVLFRRGEILARRHGGKEEQAASQAATEQAAEQAASSASSTREEAASGDKPCPSFQGGECIRVPPEAFADTAAAVRGRDERRTGEHGLAIAKAVMAWRGLVTQTLEHTLTFPVPDFSKTGGNGNAFAKNFAKFCFEAVVRRLFLTAQVAVDGKSFLDVKDRFAKDLLKATVRNFSDLPRQVFVFMEA